MKKEDVPASPGPGGPKEVWPAEIFNSLMKHFKANGGCYIPTEIIKQWLKDRPVPPFGGAVPPGFVWGLCMDLLAERGERSDPSPSEIPPQGEAGQV